MNLMKRHAIDMLYHYIAILPVGHFIMNRSKEKTQICSECSLHSLSHSAQSGSSGNYGCTDLLADRRQGSSVH